MRFYWDTLVMLSASAAMAAVIADNVLTAACLNLLGEAVIETNPLSSHLMSHWGVNLTMTANAFWALAVIVWLDCKAITHQSRFALVLLLALTLIRSVAAINNFAILKGALS